MACSLGSLDSNLFAQHNADVQDLNLVKPLGSNEARGHGHPVFELDRFAKAAVTMAPRDETMVAFTTLSG